MDKLRFWLVVSTSFLLISIFIPLAYFLLMQPGLAEQLGYAVKDFKISMRYPDYSLLKVYRSGRSVRVVITGPDLGAPLNNIFLASVVSLASTLLGVFIASAFYIYDLPRPLRILPLVSGFPIPFIKALAAQKIFDPSTGLLGAATEALLGFRLGFDGLAAVALYQIAAITPVVYSVIYGYFKSVPRELVEASYSLGGRPLRTALRVLIPYSKPAVIASAALAFVYSLDDVEAPIVFERSPAVRSLLAYRVYTFLYNEATGAFRAEASAYALILLALSAAVFALSYRYTTRILANLGPVSWARAVYREKPGSLGLLAIAASMLILLALSAPTAAAVVFMFSDSWIGVAPVVGARQLIYAVTDTRIRSALNSAAYAALALLVSTLAALPAAYVSARKSKLGAALDAAMIAPLAVPGVVLAYSYVRLFSAAPGPLRIYSSPWLYLVAAYTSRRMPYVYAALKAAFTAVPREFEEAAQTLGAKPVRSLVNAVAPQAIRASEKSLAYAALLMATEVSTSISVGALGTTTGWLSTAPIAYTIYRDVTISSYLYAGASTAITLITALILLPSSAALVKALAKAFAKL